MGALLEAPMSVPRFRMNNSLLTCVLFAPHRIPLKEFTSLRKKPEVSSPCGVTLGCYPRTPQPNLRQKTYKWLAKGLKNFTVQELKELREDRLLFYASNQRDLRIEFAHLIAKRHSVMEGLRQQYIISAHDVRGYGSVNLRTVHRKAAKKQRTTFVPAVVSDPRSRQPSGSQPEAGLPAPTSSVTRGNLATSLAAGASQSTVALG
ncbi:hypothetical protein PHPALM_27882 [Phytophthora palmivora]|uniref:Uncharacterized protein n=1 Tax=Phytophthora palmivora TaxID=4796 RepID=A0A2P4XBG8_9STRA|nr:hypothetical protein PHPALM_27882 [Phytophthora palmivora]